MFPLKKRLLITGNFDWVLLGFVILKGILGCLNRKVTVQMWFKSGNSTKCLQVNFQQEVSEVFCYFPRCLKPKDENPPKC